MIIIQFLRPSAKSANGDYQIPLFFQRTDVYYYSPCTLASNTTLLCLSKFFPKSLILLILPLSLTCTDILAKSFSGWAIFIFYIKLINIFKMRPNRTTNDGGHWKPTRLMKIFHEQNWLSGEFYSPDIGPFGTQNNYIFYILNGDKTKENILHTSKTFATFPHLDFG